MVTALPHSTAEDQLPRLLGGALCLDFLNTVDPRHAEDRVDYLTDYASLARWAAHAGAISWSDAALLLRSSAALAGHARDTVAMAIEFRERLYDGIRSLLGGNGVPARSLAVLNAEVARAHSARELVHAGQAGLIWRWREPRRLDLPVLAVAMSAADLLMGRGVARIRECPGGDGCGWLFLDLSKSGTRRWCSMQVCGNRAKVRRHRTGPRGGLAEPCPRRGDVSVVYLAELASTQVTPVRRT